MKELSIVVPAYNEEHGIVATIKKIRKEIKDAEIIVVDDASLDRTYELAKSTGVTVIKLPKNRGYGGALKSGWKAAKTPYIGFLDADLTYKPKYIIIFFKHLKKYDFEIVWGNRFGGKRNEMPRIRIVGNKILAFIFMMLTMQNVHDTACGERVFKKTLLKKIDFESLPNGLDMITAMTKRIVKRGIAYDVISMDYYMRGGASKLNVVKDFIKMLRNILFER